MMLEVIFDVPSRDGVESVTIIQGDGQIEEICWDGMRSWKAMLETLEATGMPETVDFHVAQNDGTVHGTGSHDKTGRHCQANDPKGKLDIAKCSTYWLKDAAARGMKHICWDGCMFDNSVLESPGTWNEVLKAMIAVDEAP